MDTLFLPRSLSTTLNEVGLNGGNRDLYVVPDRKLLQHLREHFYSVVAPQEIPVVDHSKVSLLDEFLEPTRFEQRIAYCVIQLRQSGVPQAEQEALIQRALSIVLEDFLETGRIRNSWKADWGSRTTLHEIISFRLSQCFAPWYYPVNILHYEILREHEFIAWDNTDDSWRLTNLGEYARRLPTFSFLQFLLGVEFTFARGRSGSRYPTLSFAKSILDKRPDTKLGRRYPRALEWYGIVQRMRDGADPDILSLSEFGYQLLGAALQRSEEIREIVFLLTETEYQGFRMEGPRNSRDSAASLADLELEPELLSHDEKASLREADRLYRSGNSLDALRLMYPLTEAVLNSALGERDSGSTSTRGMRSKIDRLVAQGLLSQKLGNLVEIVASRNKIVHGNLNSRDELLEPLFVFVAGVFRAIVAELRDKGRAGAPLD